MKEKYIIRYLPLFYRDLENIIDYTKYDLQNDVAANRLVDEVENVIKERHMVRALSPFRHTRDREL